MKKIGLICLALVLAMGAMGVGYAMWYDTVTISGGVHTGTVDIVMETQSYDRVYKNLNTDQLFYQHLIDLPGAPPPPYLGPPYLLVGETTAMVVADDTMEISYNNIFPIPGSGWRGSGYWFTDFYLHNVGTIPVKLEVRANSVGLDGCTVVVMTDSFTPFPPGNPLEGIQLEPCQGLSIGIGVFVPDDNAAQGLNGGIRVTIHGVQFNEYAPGPPP